MPPSLCGTRDGVFYANCGDLAAQPKFAMRTLTAHEAVPGHHFQIALANEMEGLPYFRKALAEFTAFVEGWGLYSERLARELGFYATTYDPRPAARAAAAPATSPVEGYDLLGHFGDELLRASRLVVDTGIHAQGWGRQRAIDYMAANTMLSPSDVVTEVERYAVLPGQACSYKVGALRIQALRDALSEELGPPSPPSPEGRGGGKNESENAHANRKKGAGGFDVRLFHRAMLEGGAVPLSTMEAHVSRRCREAAAANKEAGKEGGTTAEIY